MKGPKWMHLVSTILIGFLILLLLGLILLGLPAFLRIWRADF